MVSIGIPRYSFDPKKGDRFYVEGKLITIKKRTGDFVDFSNSVNGTTGMSVGNLYQVASVPENSRFAPYSVRAGKPVAPNPRVGSRLTPARIKVGRRVVNGFAKRVGGKVKVFVTPAVARKVNPGSAFVIKTLSKQLYDRDVKPKLRVPYNLMPFAIYRRTVLKNKPMYMLYRGGKFIKALSSKAALRRYQGRVV